MAYRKYRNNGKYQQWRNNINNGGNGVKIGENKHLAINNESEMWHQPIISKIKYETSEESENE
jgi:hypothetical protein